MVVTQQSLRRIVQEAVRRKLGETGPNCPVQVTKLTGRLTMEQLQAVIDEEFALALHEHGAWEEGEGI